MCGSANDSYLIHLEVSRTCMNALKSRIPLGSEIFKMPLEDNQIGASRGGSCQPSTRFQACCKSCDFGQTFTCTVARGTQAYGEFPKIKRVESALHR